MKESDRYSNNLVHTCKFMEIAKVNIFSKESLDKAHWSCAVG